MLSKKIENIFFFGLSLLLSLVILLTATVVFAASSCNSPCSFAAGGNCSSCYAPKTCSTGYFGGSVFGSCCCPAPTATPRPSPQPDGCVNSGCNWDPLTSSQHACNPGEYCRANSTYPGTCYCSACSDISCGSDTNNCHDISATTTCNTSVIPCVCNTPTPTPCTTCSDGVANGGKRCCGTTAIETCTVDAFGCTWIGAECPSGQTCTGTAPNAACTSTPAPTTPTPTPTPTSPPNPCNNPSYPYLCGSTWCCANSSDCCSPPANACKPNCPTPTPPPPTSTPPPSLCPAGTVDCGSCGVSGSRCLCSDGSGSSTCNSSFRCCRNP